MVTVKYPEGNWNVREIKHYTSCSYLTYPANYYGCTHLLHPGSKGSDDIPECSKEDCPIFYHGE